MAKRFSRLKYGLEMLRAPNSTAPTPDAPTGTVAKKFQDFVGKKTRLVYPRAADSKPGEINKVSVLPFYFNGAAGKETIVAQSKRADEAAPLAGVQTQCNQITVDFENHVKLAGFIPAKVTVFDYGTASTSTLSQITGERYDKKNGKSYTFPYGASATEKAEAEVRKGISAAVVTLGTASVSFSREKY
ncbi:hypothetical protein [Pleurocapsa sp. FMAR1]|uniref:hypothetical protein n=1 Tax=Pleurocapsa sp. FMAR1 TaxID=3040204 RepID=UPI0029C99450|nr:hypothetical protein [Pleurocapsa sp. FMAR1]